jgi:selenocysteine lyase/cysteine desulfurase
MLDLDFVRSQFPALQGEWVFMDNAGGSQVLRTVAERVLDYLLTSNVQTGASYGPSVESTRRVAASREAFARFMNCDADEIVEGPSTTVLIRFLSEAMTGRLQPGDEIVLTNVDHEANIGPWLKHQERGVTIKWWRCDPESFELDLNDLAALMSERTRLVCVTHASNILGTINPVRAIADIAHAAGAELCVDAVAYAPHRAIDVRAFGADYYIWSVYKVFGPHHAVMYGRRESGASGRAAVEAGFGAIAEQERKVTRRLLDFLESRNSVRVIGRATDAPAERVSTVSFTVENTSAQAVVEAVDAHKVGIRFGDFYARRIVEEHGLMERQGVVRVSMIHYNTEDEVDRLIRALEPSL